MMTPSPRARARKHRRALVTGGAVRVGRAIALALAGAGMDVAISYHRSAREARQTVRLIEACGVRGVALPANLERAAAADRLVEQVAAMLGGLDVLVNNAAVFERTPLGAVSATQYDRLLDLNLRGAFFCAQAASAIMPSGGHIVNIGDVGAARAWPGYIPYVLSKAGMVALTRGCAVALRSRRIAVNCVSPGPVLRPRGMSLARWQSVTRGKSASVEDVTAAVLFFATCGPSITGQVVEVDG